MACIPTGEMLTLFTNFFFKVDQALDLSRHSLKKHLHQQQSLGAGVSFEDEEDSMWNGRNALKASPDTDFVL